MCGRYRFGEGIWDEDLAVTMAQAVRVAQKFGVKMKTDGEIRPTDIAPVIAPSARDRSLSAFPMQWGFTHPKRGMLVFNTRMASTWLRWHSGHTTRATPVQPTACPERCL